MNFLMKYNLHMESTYIMSNHEISHEISYLYDYYPSQAIEHLQNPKTSLPITTLILFLKDNHYLNFWSHRLLLSTFELYVNGIIQYVL